MSPAEEKKMPPKTQSHFNRAAKHPSPLGTTLFVSHRLLDIVIQYCILARGWGDPLITRLGGTPLPLEGAPIAFGLPFWRLALMAMIVAGNVKGIYYLLCVTENAMPMANSVPIGVFKTGLTSVNTFVFCTSATSAAVAYVRQENLMGGVVGGWPPVLVISSLVFVLGVVMETYSEIERKWFKDDPRNVGKPYTTGMFGLARHVNYGGFVTWKTAYGLACGGWVFGVLSLVYLISEFERRGIPPLDEYCQKRVSFLRASFFTWVCMLIC
jgi:Protein of unknown function (DUF1295)